MGQLAGRVIIISGAARGQGAAAARRFAAEGARVIIGDIRDDEGKQVAGELADRGTYIHLDVRDPAGWAAAVQHGQAAYGRVDGLVNNAGVLAMGTVEQMPEQEFMQVVAVNQLGVFLGMQAVIPALRAAGGGTIVNIASVDGLIGVPMLSAYCASKFAVVGLTRVAAIELGPDRIRVNAICPGVVRTDMVSGLPQRVEDALLDQTPLRRFGEPGEIAALALFLTGHESSYCTGGSFVADGGWTAGEITP
jgi:3alpha(or 20beta)-hydroxysteroid dehydrogenase